MVFLSGRFPVLSGRARKRPAMTKTEIFLDSVEADGLACVRGERLIFRDLALAARAGQLLTLEGPNGAGKTSLLRLMAGLLPPVAGHVRFRTKTGAMITDGEERGRACAWLGHADGIKGPLTVAENARFFGALAGAENDVAAILARVGLARLTTLPAAYLSAGQRRRLGLVRLLLSRRSLWLLDEPLAALDAAGRALIAELVTEHLQGGGIAIAATHEPLGVAGERVMLGGKP